MLDKKITFIGGGNMAEGIIKASLATKTFLSKNISVYDISQERLQYLQKTYQIQIFEDLAKSVQEAEIVLIAVRPQDAPQVLTNLKNYLTKENLVISICAGITISQIQSYVGAAIKIARVMPNVLSESHYGYSGICLSENLKSMDRDILATIFNALGKTLFIAEKQFNVFTAFSCAGPAYVMNCMAGLIDAGVQAGFSRQDSRKLVLDNFIGSGIALSQTGEHPLERVDKMTSPAGVTIEGVAVLNRAGLSGILMKAVQAAVKKSEEL